MMIKMFDKNFWKAYGLTLLQLLSIASLSFLAFLLLAKNMSYVYPFITSLQQMQQTGIVTDDLVENIPLFGGFIFNLIVLLLSYIIVLSGVLSIFDTLIRGRLENKDFSFNEWLFEWFRYSSASLILLMFLYVMLLLFNNMLWLGIIILIVLFLFCYLVILMQFNLSLKKTFFRAILLFILYFVFLLLAILLVWITKLFGVFLVLLLFAFLLLWSKIYLVNK